MLKNSRQDANILNIHPTGAPKASVLREIQYILAKFSKNEAKKPLFITTPNPEQIVLAQEDEQFRKIINCSDIKLPDGVGLLAADSFLKLNLRGRGIFDLFKCVFFWVLNFYIYPFNKKILEKDLKVIPGREMFNDLVRLANKKGWRVFLLGGKGTVAHKAKEKFERNYKRVKIAAEAGPTINNAGYPLGQSDKWEEEAVVDKINSFKPHILFVAFGAPKQEKWLYRWLPKLKIGTGMVVGGTFDYIAGVQKLPPKVISNIGIEWLWRLFAGTQKLNRIIRATVIFPLEVLKYKWKS